VCGRGMAGWQLGKGGTRGACDLAKGESAGGGGGGGGGCGLVVCLEVCWSGGLFFVFVLGVGWVWFFLGGVGKGKKGEKQMEGGRNGGVSFVKSPGQGGVTLSGWSSKRVP